MNGHIRRTEIRIETHEITIIRSGRGRLEPEPIDDPVHLEMDSSIALELSPLAEDEANGVLVAISGR